MPKKSLKKWFPSQETIQNHKSLRFLGRLLHNPNLFHLNRRSASRAFLIGLFWAFIPMPFQMVPAMLCAVLLHANAPISVGLVWITNPLTMPPIFYFNYLIGSWLLGDPTKVAGDDFGASSFWDTFTAIWQPFYLGSLMMGIVFASFGYYAIRALWRWHVLSCWHKRQLKRANPG